MSNQDNNPSPRSPVPDRKSNVTGRTNLSVGAEAEFNESELNESKPNESELNESEFNEAEFNEAEILAGDKLQGVMAFLDRVRIDLERYPIEQRAEDEDQVHVSTRTAQNTLRENPARKNEMPVKAMIGRFTVIETIGEGGFAVVVRAFDPVLGREVALKLPKPDALASQESASRFCREARAAAMLSHPGIVPVFESGVAGLSSYIASEYCPGETLATWFKNRNREIDHTTAASIVNRLAEAVEHAHQRGVVHRDLKPANILVDHSVENQRIADRLRITDFGLAKQMDKSVESLTLEGAVVGTPAYMSPEQASGAGDVGAAADIYALGVILFELLSGRLPFTKKNHLETLRAVESEPAPVLNRIDRSIPRDLSAICQKCLSKVPSERYSTAFDLAEDLSAWRENRPVRARPVGIARRFRQWYARNTPLASALIFAFASLVLGLAISLWQWDSAIRQTHRADRQLKKTEEANAQSLLRLNQIERFNQALTGIFDDLNIDKVRQSNRPLEQVLAERLVLVGNQFNVGLVGDRLVEADLKTKLAESLVALGFASDAIGFASSAVDIRVELLGENDLLTATSRSCLGDAYREDGKYESALLQHRQVHAIRVDQLPPDDLLILASRNQIAVALQRLGKFDEAIDEFEIVLATKLSILDPKDPSTLTSMNNLAAGYMLDGRFALAESMYLETLKLRNEVLDENHFDTLTSMDQLARCYLDQGKIDAALPLLKDTLQRRSENLGPNHTATLTSISSMASGYRADGQFDKALELFEDVLARRKLRLGVDHELTNSSVHDLAVMHYSLKDYEKALPLLEKSYQAFKKDPGPEHFKTLAAMQSLAATYYKVNQIEPAIELLAESIDVTRAKFGLDNPKTIDGLKNLSILLFNLGRYQDAAKQYKLLIEALTMSPNPEELRIREAKADLGVSYRWAKNYPLAIETLESVLAGDEPISDESYYRSVLRAAYALGGHNKEFQSMADEDLAEYRATFEPGSNSLRSKLATLGMDCLFAENYSMAKTLLEESMEILERVDVTDHRWPNNQSLLGGALMGLEEFDEAGPMLRSGYQGLVEHVDSIPSSARADTLIDAAERLLRFYQHQGRVEKVEEMQDDLRQLRAEYDR